MLERIIESRDRPDAICCGNGAENISSLIEAWAGAERFNRIVRYECLIHYCWDDLDGGRLFATRWMYKFNHQRPHMALGDFIPKQRLAMAAGHELMVSGCYTQSFISNYHCRL